MNSITNQIQSTIKSKKMKPSDDPDFWKLQEMLQERKRLGLFKKPTYTFPPIDTIGRRYYSRKFQLAS
jgi:hypothetical protein